MKNKQLEPTIGYICWMKLLWLNKLSIFVENLEVYCILY